MLSFWKQAPFLQILIPFIVGILLYRFVPSIPLWMVIGIMALSVLLYALFHWLGKKKNM